MKIGIENIFYLPLLWNRKSPPATDPMGEDPLLEVHGAAPVLDMVRTHQTSGEVENIRAVTVHCIYKVDNS